MSRKQFICDRSSKHFLLDWNLPATCCTTTSCSWHRRLHTTSTLIFWCISIMIIKDENTHLVCLLCFTFCCCVFFYSNSIKVWRMDLLLHFSATGLYLKNNLSNEYNLMQLEHHNCTCSELTRLCWRNFIIEILIGLCGFLLYPCILSNNNCCDLIAVNNENRE